MSDRILTELAEASRRRILGELRTGPKSVSEIVAATGMKQPNVSNHLARLREADLVKAVKQGRQVVYSLHDPKVDAALGLAEVPVSSDFWADDWVEQYAEAAMHGDERTVFSIVDRALTSGAQMVDLYIDLLTPAMFRVGDRWMKGEIDEAREHLATAITERVMARIAHFRGPTAPNGRTALLGCSPGNLHSLGLRMVADCLKGAGWKTWFLGANVPLEAFLDSVWTHQPELVLIGCGAPSTEADCEELVRQLALQKNLDPSYTIIVGGYCVNQDPQRFLIAGGDHHAPDLRTFFDVILPQIPPRS